MKKFDYDLSLEVMLKAEDYSKQTGMNIYEIIDHLQYFIYQYICNNKHRIFTNGILISELEQEANNHLLSELIYEPEELGIYDLSFAC